jgi:hypothetical protein
VLSRHALCSPNSRRASGENASCKGIVKVKLSACVIASTICRIGRRHFAAAVQNAPRDAYSRLTAVVFFCWYSATDTNGCQNVTAFSLSTPEWHFTFSLVELNAFLRETDH